MPVAPDHQVLAVDGERFAVDYDETQPGAYHFTWLTGRDPDYGFTTRVSDHQRQQQEFVVEAARGFLAAIDPETGYLADNDPE